MTSQRWVWVIYSMYLIKGIRLVFLSVKKTTKISVLTRKESILHSLTTKKNMLCFSKLTRLFSQTLHLKLCKYLIFDVLNKNKVCGQFITNSKVYHFVLYECRLTVKSDSRPYRPIYSNTVRSVNKVMMRICCWSTSLFHNVPLF